MLQKQYFDGDLQLAEPHFDEEGTVLSARPVVPLNDIAAERRSVRRLVFGLLIAASLMIGAFGAILVYRQRGVADAVLNAAVAGSGAMANDLPVTGSSKGEVDTDEGDVEDPHSSAAEKNPKPQIVRKVQAVKAGKKQDEVRHQVYEREEPRAERFEAWRLRRRAEREARRESRGQRDRPTDDLLRIREIFEGRRRP